MVELIRLCSICFKHFYQFTWHALVNKLNNTCTIKDLLGNLYSQKFLMQPKRLSLSLSLFSLKGTKLRGGYKFALDLKGHDIYSLALDIALAVTDYILLQTLDCMKEHH